MFSFWPRVTALHFQAELSDIRWIRSSGWFIVPPNPLLPLSCVYREGIRIVGRQRCARSYKSIVVAGQCHLIPQPVALRLSRLFPPPLHVFLFVPSPSLVSSLSPSPFFQTIYVSLSPSLSFSFSPVIMGKHIIKRVSAERVRDMWGV